MKYEKEALGEYISGSINDLYKGFFTGVGVSSIARAKLLPDKNIVKVEAIVTDVKKEKIKSGKNAGKPYARCSIIDANDDSIQMTVWTDKLKIYKDKLKTDTPIRAVCKINVWNDVVGLVLERLERGGFSVPQPRRNNSSVN